MPTYLISPDVQPHRLQAWSVAQASGSWSNLTTSATIAPIILPYPYAQAVNLGDGTILYVKSAYGGGEAQTWLYTIASNIWTFIRGSVTIEDPNGTPDWSGLLYANWAEEISEPFQKAFLQLDPVTSSAYLFRHAYRGDHWGPDVECIQYDPVGGYWTSLGWSTAAAGYTIQYELGGMLWHSGGYHILLLRSGWGWQLLRWDPPFVPGCISFLGTAKTPNLYGCGLFFVEDGAAGSVVWTHGAFTQDAFTGPLGVTPIPTDNAWIYDIDSGITSDLPALTRPSARINVASVKGLGNNLYMLGGSSGHTLLGGTVFAETWKLTVSGGLASWEQVLPGAPPNPGYRMIVVGAPNEMPLFT